MPSKKIQTALIKRKPDSLRYPVSFFSDGCFNPLKSRLNLYYYYTFTFSATSL